MGKNQNTPYFESLVVGVFHIFEATLVTSSGLIHYPVCFWDIVINIGATNVSIHLHIKYISLSMLYLMKILNHILILIHCIVVVLFRRRLLLLVIRKLQVHLYHPNSRKTRCHSASQIPPILVIFQHMITLGYYMMSAQRHWLMITLSALK